MTTYAVYTEGSFRKADRQMDDLPIYVDDTTSVHLASDDYTIVLAQGSNIVRVPDPYALTGALTKALLVQAERQAMDDRPMTSDHRKAIFAGLREVYGKDISRERRLAIISAIVGREVVSLSVDHWNPVPLTRAEASHVLDVLNA